MRYFYISLFVCLFLLLDIQTKSSTLVYSQNLSTSERMLKWVAQQFGINVPLDQSLCNTVLLDIPIFTCSGGHVTKIQIQRTIFTSKGAPDNTLDTLDFPALTIFYYINNTVTNQALNTLLKLRNVPTLQSLYVGDQSITTIPNDFPTTFPLLSSFASYLGLSPSPTLFNNSNIETLSLFAQINGPFILDATVSMKKLMTLSMYYSSLDPILFTQSAYPKLSALSLTFPVANSISNISILQNSMVSLALFAPTFNSGFNVVLGNTSNLKDLQISGPLTTLSPASLNDYPSLIYARFINTSLTSYPFNFWPDKLTYLEITKSNFIIPNTPVSPKLETLIFSGNNINQVPWNIFNNAPLLSLSLSSNPGLVGTVPESMCGIKKLDINQTGIQAVPNCFWCYDTASSVLVTSLPRPPGNLCSGLSFDSVNLLSIFGKVKVKGNMIGFGNPQNQPYPLIATIPNKLLEFQVPTPLSNFYTPQSTVLKLSPTNPNITMAVTIVEVGIALLPQTDFSMTQINHGVMVKIQAFTFNNQLLHTITLNSNTYQCNGMSQTTSSISCVTPTPLPSGTYSLNISNIGYSEIIHLRYTPTYPTISSASSFRNDNDDIKVINLFGNFGDNGQNTPVVMINNTIPCTIQYINSSYINCSTIHNQYGAASVFVSVDGVNFTRPNVLYFYPPESNNNNNGTTSSTTISSTTTTTTTTGGPPQLTLKEQCEQQTQNCYGNGQCQDNGKCQCNPGYNLLDNCLTKYFNDTIPIETNTTAPVTKFNIEGVQFMFEMYSVQELDIDGETVIQEVLTEKWLSNVTTEGTLTSVNYTLVSNETTANVSAAISFSSQQREIAFGDRNFTIAPNSIKVTVEINNWKFQSNIASLRVIFKTLVNTSQGVSVGCDSQQIIDPFAYDSYGSTIQYLRVVKQGIQFTGRFLDYVLSDGRSTYSRTQLVSLNNTDTSHPDESIALIGVNLPQCQSCVLDPDFTPLIIDNSRVSTCGGSSSSDILWKIIVGACVGGVVFIALLVGLVAYLKDSNSFRLRFRKNDAIIMKKI
ncbi:hypothetical protein DFA_00071 [Cavenderia fasciculata]|uniref:EGF-like domain-containing protein n=1 Tax=Cavenderia fasciculata TaxID=261658 RepID=F4PXI4_CACFS|nr:uncharacterized protein DFA_00071 [Cavenderia fasciculata]EGG19494.1 hypothetical protein DFA_00071 [Cavenderia fasciculata]|eukprot:XP_004357788.1 hypothetical protein DFA_00071 [Cavenderia fasciculata]